MAHILTVSLDTALDNSRTATSFETHEEAIAAGKQALVDTLDEEEDVKEEYEDQGNELDEDKESFADTGSFLFEGMGCTLKIAVVKVSDKKADAYIAGFVF